MLGAGHVQTGNSAFLPLRGDICGGLIVVRVTEKNLGGGVSKDGGSRALRLGWKRLPEAMCLNLLQSGQVR